MNPIPWRENVVPHRDVLEGTFQQAEFAADITAVRLGRAPRQYQDPATFFQRTFITEGMARLLTAVAQRLAGQGAEPVIQLKTAFGGGKTHTLVAIHHLATRTCPLADLPGIPELLKRVGLDDLPTARVAVLDGVDRGLAEVRRHGKTTVRTLWGELAWQLGGEAGFALVRASDESGTSPGKDVLRQLMENHAPCVVLIDELVAYLRQLPGHTGLPGGTYESNLSFIQALTEAAKLVPNAIVLASLPESEIEAGGDAGVNALKALTKVFGRVQAVWKPVETEESFEIVRRRLFETVKSDEIRATVCRAFADLYVAEGARLPGETQEGRYFERLLRAYPIHPEVFDRLFEDWSSLESFQRTRGVLKLMARVIHELWRNGNRDALILPSSLPLDASAVRNELVEHLPPGWDPVLERDIDGPRAETTQLESRETRFGPQQAARRVARTLFLGTAPGSEATRRNHRGLERARVLLGCLQPGQGAAVFSDALNRLSDLCHYLNGPADKTSDSARFWFDTRANLRREMEERKRRFPDTGPEVRARLLAALRRLTAGAGFPDGVHVFAPHADVPDDSALRLVVLPPEARYFKEDPTAAFDAVREHLRQHGGQPRFRVNRLLFLAPDHAALTRAVDAARTELAWESIVRDVETRQLNLDGAQADQAKKELKTAGEVVPRTVREAFKWLLVPGQTSPTAADSTIEVFAIPVGAGTVSDEIKRVCTDHELVIQNWAAIHLANLLREFYWKPERPAVVAEEFWKDCQRYLYLPRLRSRDVFEGAVLRGAASRDYFGTAGSGAPGKWEGFRYGAAPGAVDDALLLIEPGEARTFEQAQEQSRVNPPPRPPGPVDGTGPGKVGGVVAPPPPPDPPGTGPRHLHLSIDVNAAGARLRLTDIAAEIIAHLTREATAEVKVTLEIDVNFPNGVSQALRRTIDENAVQLKVRKPEWE